MFDHVTLVSAIFVALATVYGLCSRLALVLIVIAGFVVRSLFVLMGLTPRRTAHA